MVRKEQGKAPTELGRALIRNKTVRKRLIRQVGRAQSAVLHTEDDDGDAAEEASLTSIMQRDAVDEFFATAHMKQQNFAAQKMQVITVSGPSVVHVTKKQAVEQLEYEHIRIPRRPKWRPGTTAEELAQMEREAFLNWRRELAMYEENVSEKHATPFEKNLEVWKQLWRVAERSHVIAQIVDARNPLLFYCRDLFSLAKELNPGKSCLLVINKADFLTRRARLYWARYLRAQGIDFVFWSAKQEQDLQRAAAESEAAKLAALVAAAESKHAASSSSSSSTSSSSSSSPTDAGADASVDVDAAADADADVDVEAAEGAAAAAETAAAAAAASGFTGEAEIAALRAEARKARQRASAAAAATAAHRRAGDRVSDRAAASGAAAVAGAGAGMSRFGTARSKAVGSDDMVLNRTRRTQERDIEMLKETRRVQRETQLRGVGESAQATAKKETVQQEERGGKENVEHGEKEIVEEADEGEGVEEAVLDADAEPDAADQGTEEDAEDREKAEEEEEEETDLPAPTPDPWAKVKPIVIQAKAPASATPTPAPSSTPASTPVPPSLPTSSRTPASAASSATFVAHASIATPAQSKVDSRPVDEAADEDLDGTRILGHQGLLDAFRARANAAYLRETYEANPRLAGDPSQVGRVIVGMLGFPNVGKSSTINALLGAKKVSVAATPGHTKHLQTLYLGDDIMLCDCPGLVFPTFVESKASLVVNGVIPIDTLNDYVSPVHLVTERISRSQIAQLYGLEFPVGLRIDGLRLLDAYAHARGFYQNQGNTDRARVSRLVLKDYVNGRLLYCQTPPGLSAEERKAFYKSFSEDPNESSATCIATSDTSAAHAREKQRLLAQTHATHDANARESSEAEEEEGEDAVEGEAQLAYQGSSTARPHLLDDAALYDELSAELASAAFFAKNAAEGGESAAAGPGGGAAAAALRSQYGARIPTRSGGGARGAAGTVMVSSGMTAASVNKAASRHAHVMTRTMDGHMLAQDEGRDVIHVNVNRRKVVPAKVDMDELVPLPSASQPKMPPPPKREEMTKKDWVRMRKAMLNAGMTR